MTTNGCFRLTTACVPVFFVATAAVAASPGEQDNPSISCGAEFDHHAHGPRRPELVEGSLSHGVPRPGPDVLYWPLATSPQIENTGPWHADPILVSGASAYRRGEFLYQDFLYDDTGARGNLGTSGGGTYTYPTDPAYARNAADLVEVRIKLLEGGTAIRLTYNTMLNPELVAATIVLGDAAGTRPLPYGVNAQAPAEVFVTIHGSSGDVIDAATGNPIEGVVPGVNVDLHRRQVHVCVPFEAFDPRGQSSVRIAAAVGLWDAANNLYLLPLAGPPDETHPGGAGELTNPPGFFNLAFRYQEPSSGFTAAWRDTAQAAALALGDLSPFFANVDFVALHRGLSDDMPDQVGGVPQSGYMNRILVSHFEDSQGRGSAVSLQPENCPDGCEPPQYAGRLQPYEIYVPTRRPPHSGYGLVVNPHAAGGNHNNYLAFVPREQVQFGERGSGSIVITPNARGTAYWYYGEAGADVFEVWADVAHHYRLDPNSTLIGGLSMGGYATWKLGGQFPDLFAATPMMVPCPSAGVFYQEGGEVPGGVASLTRLLAPSFRNVPQLIWVGSLDPVCAYWAQLEYANLMDELGYRYQIYSFPVGHAFPLGNEFTPMVDWMDSRRVVRDPPHVTYVMNAEMHQPEVGLNADHAYWVSDLRVRDVTVSPPVGSIDVFSHGFGIGDPEPTETQHAAGEYITETGQPISYTLQARDWRAAPRIRVQNRIDIVAHNILAVRIHTARARVTCHAAIHVQSDGPLHVTLAGCDGHEGER